MTEPIESTAGEYFGARVAEYDALIRACVPRYDEMLERLVGYLPPAPAAILELGTGTGNLACAVAARFPDAALTLVDAAPEMLELAGQRLPGASRVVSRFEGLAMPEGSFDLITSAISLHHVEDTAAHYARLFAALRPGGALVVADQLMGRTPDLHGVNWEAWLAHCRAPGNCTEEQTRSFLDHAAAHDHYTPLEEHFDLLRATGFVELDCVWRNWIWGIIHARRPA